MYLLHYCIMIPTAVSLYVRLHSTYSRSKHFREESGDGFGSNTTSKHSNHYVTQSLCTHQFSTPYSISRSPLAQYTSVDLISSLQPSVDSAFTSVNTDERLFFYGTYQTYFITFVHVLTHLHFQVTLF